MSHIALELNVTNLHIRSCCNRIRKSGGQSEDFAAHLRKCFETGQRTDFTLFAQMDRTLHQLRLGALCSRGQNRNRVPSNTEKELSKFSLALGYSFDLHSLFIVLSVTLHPPTAAATSIAGHHRTCHAEKGQEQTAMIKGTG
ncbi:uncharacterized protein LOC108960967 [Eucalyptus grandis]|uniref:uncharacterized protein LOC108960967 n=1 Tax=Eucalyptus grandis TaxID=71139 RepID=UPI00192EA851|nr:uncharacterized protein LOC108960967 [Eucalyptus grandis]